MKEAMKGFEYDHAFSQENNVPGRVSAPVPPPPEPVPLPPPEPVPAPEPAPVPETAPPPAVQNFARN